MINKIGKYKERDRVTPETLSTVFFDYNRQTILNIINKKFNIENFLEDTYHKTSSGSKNTAWSLKANAHPIKIKAAGYFSFIKNKRVSSKNVPKIESHCPQYALFRITKGLKSTIVYTNAFFVPFPFFSIHWEVSIHAATAKAKSNKTETSTQRQKYKG